MDYIEEMMKIAEVEPKTIPCPHKGCRNHYTHPCEVCNNRRFIEVYPDFTQALAQLTTELIKTNELDKQKAKRILEG